MNWILGMSAYEEVDGKGLYRIPKSGQPHDRPELGVFVRVDTQAVKYRKDADYNSFTTEWLAKPIKQVWGIYIGFRTLTNGYSRRYNDSQPYFSPGSTREGWLVVIDPRKNPILVFPETIDIRFIPPMTLNSAGLRIEFKLE